jgi:hypothetical protein
MYLYPQELLPIKTYCQSRGSISVVPFWIARPAFTHLADWNARDRWRPSVQCHPHVKTSGVLDTLWAHCTRSWALPWSKMSTAILQNYQTMQVIISALIRPLLFNYYVIYIFRFPEIAWIWICRYQIISDVFLRSEEHDILRNGYSNSIRNLQGERW